MTEEQFDGQTLKGMLHAAQKGLEKHVEEVNLLNVFPVPDGDTGINMFLTLRATNKAVSEVSATSVSVVSARAARGALLGARGNSGVILSQIIRGIAKGLEAKERFSCHDLARALLKASENAYNSITNPVEGTILTVAREASDTAQNMVRRGASLKELMNAIVTQARKSVQKTPELLPVLKEAGVVDAGAKGLFYALKGMKEFISKRTVSSKTTIMVDQHLMAKPVTVGYGFDVQFLLKGENLPLLEIRQQIEKWGDSVLVVGDENLIRVHVHTKVPETVLNYVSTKGQVNNLSLEDMDKQAEAFQKRIQEAKKRTALN